MNADKISPIQQRGEQEEAVALQPRRRRRSGKKQ
jgi:hypothetical protein